MDERIVAIGIGAFLIILIIILFMVISYKDHQISEIKRKTKDDIEKERSNYEKRLSMEKDELKREYEDKIYHLKNDIETRREVLSKMSDKDLLISIMQALDIYKNKFSEIEDSINDQTASLSERIDDQTNSLTSKIDEQTNDIGFDIQSVKSSLDDDDDYSSLSSKIDSLDYEVRNAVSAAEDARSAAEEARSAIDSMN